MADEQDLDEALIECVTASKRLGRDPRLVLHGGGNSSVKSSVRDITGEQLSILYVKGSGYDLATIVPEGFAPLRLDRVLELARLEELDDVSLVNELRQASLRADAPTASIETILHALIPHKFVLHTHADAIVTLTNQPDGEAKIRLVVGEKALVLPYAKPGFTLAQQVATILRSQDPWALSAIVLENHGLFTFGQTAEEALQRHLDLVRRAEQALPEWTPAENVIPTPSPEQYARLRAEVSNAAGAPVILHRRPGTVVDALLERPDLTEVSQVGPLTPEHVLRTKRLPMLGNDVSSYAAAYKEYVARNRHRAPGELAMIDPAPRILLDPELGFISVGRSIKEANIAADVYEHTAAAIIRAEAMDGYRSVSEEEAFDIEYWELEQRKLHSKAAPPVFEGEVALVTGAASGIGRGCADALRKQGACVIALDQNDEITADDGADWFGIHCDVTDREAVQRAVQAGVDRFGGIDMVVPCAGVFAASHPIDDFPADPWHASLDVNVTGLLNLLREVRPYLALAPEHGRVVLVGSKNVPAPGRGAAAYSASKAAASQLARVAALEWAGDKIRVNIVNPDAVFDTALWTPELLEERAAKYGLTVDEYKRRNLLKKEITSAEVGSLVAVMCGPDFAATTGTQVAIDGGSERIV